MIVPQKFTKGDYIGIVSPSDALTSSNYEKLKSGIRKLEELGFKVVHGRNYNKKYYYAAGNGKEKADDINNFFADKRIKGIFCTQGGDTANAVLPYLNFSLIAENPKVFMGFSDISLLLNAIAKKTGLVTYLGPDIVWKFGSNFSDYDHDTFVNIFFKEEKHILPNSQWQLLKKSNKKPFRGLAWGGNARCFMKLIGTEWFPDLQDAILLVEEVNKTPAWFDALFEQWKQMGWFHKLNGIMLGYNHKCIDVNESNNRKIEDILLEKAESYDVNILKINEFGHKSDHAPFPIGLPYSNIDVSQIEFY